MRNFEHCEESGVREALKQLRFCETKYEYETSKKRALNAEIA